MGDRSARHLPACDHAPKLLTLLATQYWPALAVTLLSLLANAASPSRPERLLWTPVLLMMAAAGLGVGLL